MEMDSLSAATKVVPRDHREDEGRQDTRTRCVSSMHTWAEELLTPTRGHAAGKKSCSGRILQCLCNQNGRLEEQSLSLLSQEGNEHDFIASKTVTVTAS